MTVSDQMVITIFPLRQHNDVKLKLVLRFRSQNNVVRLQKWVFILVWRKRNIELTKGMNMLMVKGNKKK